MAGREGFEPSASWLTANCSTVELTPQIKKEEPDESDSSEVQSENIHRNLKVNKAIVEQPKYVSFWMDTLYVLDHTRQHGIYLHALAQLNEVYFVEP